MKLASLKPKHFRWEVEGSVGIVTLDRPDRKNPLTFDSYAELRDTFRSLPEAEDVDAVVITAPARTSARAATSTRSSARWSRWT
jgi:enoyl-CoA hydratase/carnithine racemase